MNNIEELLFSILFGDYGLLTITPKYLFGVLFPIMLLLELLQKYLPISEKYIHYTIGFGCTTAALASLTTINQGRLRIKVSIFLIMLIPCSSQLAIISTFASMVSIRVFMCYLAIAFAAMAILVFSVNKLIPVSLANPSKTIKSDKSLLLCLKDAFSFVCDTAVPFSIGSILITIADYIGIFHWLGHLCMPIMTGFFGLPQSTSSIFILNILKRDFGSASLLSLMHNSCISASQLIVILIMLTFTVPCFNSTIMLFKQERLPIAIVLWSGSLFFSLFIGKIASILLIGFI